MRWRMLSRWKGGGGGGRFESRTNGVWVEAAKVDGLRELGEERIWLGELTNDK